ncbi:hypothetical protein BX265_6003 [Streptomyces sp. TLI_235]|nr:hypothetical protein [Streptomyces sp. TLI_235]PBC71403.1 hypothetical protein BX265_6003 [Streptomyces sp. TLI_235]
MAADPGLARVPEVFAVLARRRTDLLPALLAAGTASAGTPWLPALPGGADRRTTAAHTALVGPVAADEGEPLAVRAAAAAVLTDPARLADLAAEAPPPVAAAAFGAALGALVAGDPAPHRWDTVLDLTRDRPTRLPTPAFPGSLRPDAALLHGVTERLRADGGTAAGLLGVRLLTAYHHWTNAGGLRADLAAWHDHPDPDVAEEALLAAD